MQVLITFDTVRFIPTHAGNTPQKPIARPATAVHPHTRGEHFSSYARRLFRRGSSPHTRGTRSSQSLSQSLSRFIPTHAGNTFAGLFCRKPGAVHPHTRGEHASARASREVGGGSSPHTRGTLRQGQFVARPGRFIPTHAGNTSKRRLTLSPIAVHPHTRGEHRGSIQ